jgi:hypothetical protein
LTSSRSSLTKVQVRSLITEISRLTRALEAERLQSANRLAAIRAALGAAASGESDPLACRRLVSELAPGSYLTINHSTSAVSGEAMEEAARHWNQVGTPSMNLRTPQQIKEFFDGLELLPPGVVSCSRWRPDLTKDGWPPAEVDEFCGVARKR